jgi:hypothetical protein
MAKLADIEMSTIMEGRTLTVNIKFTRSEQVRFHIARALFYLAGKILNCKDSSVSFEIVE